VLNLRGAVLGAQSSCSFEVQQQATEAVPFFYWVESLLFTWFPSVCFGPNFLQNFATSFISFSFRACYHRHLGCMQRPTCV
jgi:hypothetical protein